MARKLKASSHHRRWATLELLPLRCQHQQARCQHRCNSQWHRCNSQCHRSSSKARPRLKWTNFRSNRRQNARLWFNSQFLNSRKLWALWVTMQSNCLQHPLFPTCSKCRKEEVRLSLLCWRDFKLNGFFYRFEKVIRRHLGQRWSNDFSTQRHATGYGHAVL